MAYKVGNFTFDTVEEADAAKKEAQAIAYITKQIDLNNPDAILATYRAMLSKDLFHTTLGVAFLQEVYDMLIKQPSLQGQDIPKVPQTVQTEKAAEEEQKPEAEKQPKQEKQPKIKKAKRRKKDNIQQSSDVLKYKKRSEILGIACGAMLVIIIAMFVINMTSEHPTILNYEEKIVNKYAAWEEELTLKEQELNQREQKLQK